uniref:Uncharacterized protein n=1 Tax=Trypanosoma vivax (strain Y486) TaxID=1055687 RepID=G0TZJ8_TRYVY|nr:conserved hypothetical protein [Trypanosoma vivax Y486]
MSMDTCRDLLEHCDNIDVEVPFLLPDTGSTQSVQQTLSNVLSGTSRDHLSLQEKLRDALSNAHARPSAVSYDNLISGLTADSSLSRFYRVVGPNFKFLLCGNNITSEDECPDFTHLSDVLYHTRVKAISGACPTPGKSCSVTECAANCTNPRAKEVSQKIVRGSKEARNASIALTYVRPFLECNFVIDVLLKAVETCDDFPAPATMLGVGFFVGGLVFVCALCVAFRGSKSFRK